MMAVLLATSLGINTFNEVEKNSRSDSAVKWLCEAALDIGGPALAAVVIATDGSALPCRVL